MKRKSLLLLLLLALFMPWAVNAQSVQVGDGTSTNSYLPSYNFYNYSLSQQIYTAEEIAASGNITSIAFYNGGAEKSRQYDIYMAHTTKTVFDTITDWIALTDADIVYHGTAATTMTAGEWTTFTLDTPFAYNGTDNLVVAVIDRTGDYSSSPHMACRVFTTEANQSLALYNDNYSALNPNGTNGEIVVNGTLRTVKNQIVLGGIQQAFPAPTNLTASDLYGHGATIDWTENGTATSWKVAYKVSTEEEFTEVTVNSKPYTFTGLDPETTYNVKVCAKSGSQQSSWSSMISFTTTVACPAPTGLAATLTPGNGSVATLNWTSTATDWVLEYGTADDFTGATSVNVSGTPSKNITGLTPETTYYARVKSVCGGDDGESEWSTSISFAPTDAYMLTVNEGTNTNGYVPVYGYWADNYSKSQFILPADDLTTMQWGTINRITFYSSNANVSWGAAKFEVYMTEVDYTTFEAATLVDWNSMEKVMYAGSLAISGNVMEINLDAPYQYMGGNLMIGVLESTSGSYSTSTWYGVNQESATALGGYETAKSLSMQQFLPKTTLYYIPGEAPSCVKPTGLSVEYNGGTEATITWNTEASSSNLNVNGTLISGVTSPYTLEGLELATSYAVMVQADCGGSTSDWTSAVNFDTDLCMPEDMCQISYVLQDSYGDGWNGNAINVVDVNSGIVIASLTISNGSNLNGTLSLCERSEIQFVWQMGTYPGEASWSITDVNGETLTAGQGSTSLTTGTVLYSYTVDCTITDCKRPSGLAVSSVGPHSAVLNWVENGLAEAWVVEVDGVTYDADVKPYTIEGLTPETEYTVRVRPVCDDGYIKWSDEFTFTTDVACPAPTGLVASEIGSNSALISWSAFGDNYDLRYAAVPTSKSYGATYKPIVPIEPTPNAVLATAPKAQPNANTKGDQLRDSWYYYDNGTYGTSIGLGGATVWWASMFPAGMIGENQLTKIALYENSYNTEDITVYIYSGGDDAPGTLLYSETYTPVGGDDFNEVTLATPVDFDPSENLWIVFEEYGTYPANACEDDIDDPNNRWISLDGSSWVDVATAGVSGYGWMIRVYVENGVDPGTLDWTYVYGIENLSYTLDGLDPSTQYMVQVKANCGSDESNWTSTYFTTLPSCVAPTNLLVSDITGHEATLTWDANGEDAWDICFNDDESNLINVSENVYNFENLDPETTYTVKVRANCGADGYSDWSAVVSFTTDVACPAPRALTVTDITASSAHVSWTSSGSSFQLRYAPSNGVFQGFVTDPGAMSDGADASWVKGSQSTWGPSANNANGYMLADDFTVTSSTTLTEIEVYGYQTGSGTTSTLTGLYVMIYDGNPKEDGVCIWGDNTTNIMTSTSFTNCYRGSDNTPTAMTRPIMAATATGLDIALEPGTYYLAYGLTGSMSSGPWGTPHAEPEVGHFGDGLQLSSSGWAYLNDSGIGAGYGIAMKLTFDDMDWTTISNISELSQDLTGLDNDAHYVVEVRSNCGAEGYSAWHSACFSTVSLCDVPTGLAATEITSNSATIGWVGSQDTYNLQYGYVDKETVLEIDFENGIIPDDIDNESDYPWTIQQDPETYNYYIMSSNQGVGSSTSTITIEAEFTEPTKVAFDAECKGEGTSTAWDACAFAIDGTAQFSYGASVTGWNHYEFTVEAGTHTLTWSYSKDSSVDPTGDYFAVDNIVFVLETNVDLDLLEEVTAPYELTGLDPNTTYYVMVQGVNSACTGGVTEWTEMLQFTTEDVPAVTTVTQEITLNEGWNYFSSFVEYDADALEAFEDAIAEYTNNGMIKNDITSNILAGGDWTNDFDAMSNNKMYLINVEDEVIFEYEGNLVDPSTTTLTLNQGWTWIPYLSNEIATLAEALANITPNEGDQIKGAGGFATYTDGAWVTQDIPTLNPGKGYMYLNYGEEMTLEYPVISTKAVMNTPVENYWNYDIHKFPTTLSMIVTLDPAMFELRAGNYEIGAFVNGECRGSARLINVNGNFMALLSVRGNNGEEVSFRLYDVYANEELAGTAEERISYVSDAVVGGAKNPMMLHFTNTSLNEFDGTVAVFPNPVKDNVMVYGNNIQMVKVYNAMGQLLINKEVDNAEQVEINLDQFSAGVYTVSILTNGQVVNKAVVKE